ncbi:MAG: ABC transporter ATP-binding protein [Anaerolineaceae bacterium]|nr:ABC transporter ATP-binding protein [Anaerolineaceae bacterium]
MSSDIFIECENLVKVYKIGGLEVIALKGLDLQVRSGEMIALVGPSGSGKSTLMNTLGALDTPSAGTVRVGKHDLSRMSPREKVMFQRREVGFMWQQADRNLLPYLTAQENVEFPMILDGTKARDSRQRAQRLLTLVGLEHRLNHLPKQLSVGELQRTALAVALANQPDLLLADEPTGAVDSQAANHIFDALHTLNQEFGTTIVIVTHDHTVIKRVNRVAGIRDGFITTEIIRRETDSRTGGTEQEYAVMDRVGRVFLPPTYIETLDMESRIRLLLQGDHISLYPEYESENANPR